MFGFGKGFAIILIISVVIATISYEFLEKRFLKKKDIIFSRE